MYTILSIYAFLYVCLLKIVLAGAFYPNYFTWKISDEELSLRQMSGLDPTTTVMVRVIWLRWLCYCTLAVLLVNSCQGYRHTPTSTGHCCVKCLVCMEKGKLFILMAPGSVTKWLFSLHKKCYSGYASLPGHVLCTVVRILARHDHWKSWWSFFKSIAWPLAWCGPVKSSTSVLAKSWMSTRRSVCGLWNKHLNKLNSFQVVFLMNY